MNKSLILILMFFAVACERKPFVESKLDLKKKSDDCGQLQATFRMTSNFGGERFEFEKCLPVDKSKEIISERRGDTVVVQFSKLSGAPKALYEVTLDIDSYPKYSFITIDDDTYTIIPVNK